MPTCHVRQFLSCDDITCVCVTVRFVIYSLNMQKCMAYGAEDSRPRGRPKRTWREDVENDCQTCILNMENTMDRSSWRKLVKDV